MVLTVQKAKELMKAQDMDVQTIDWASYSDDEPLEDYLKREYELVLTTLEEEAGSMKALFEEEKIKRQAFKDNELDAFIKPNNFLIIGKKGSAKTSLGFKFLEEIKSLSKKKAYIFDYPAPELLSKLPFRVTNLTSIKQLFNLTDSVCLIDEAHRYFDVLNKSVNEDLKLLLSGSRQNNCSFIFITHNSYFITRGLFSYIDIRIIKEVNEGHWEMERPHMNKLYRDTNIYGKEWFFIDSDFWRGREHFVKPDWFTDEFSNAYKVQGIAAKESFFERVRRIAGFP